jgi:NTE family protein
MAKIIKVPRKTITNTTVNNKYHFKNLVFEGGGVKGIAYVGVLERLNDRGILQNIERVAGTSAGAMVAVLVGLGYTAKDINDILWDINFQNFMDSSWGIIRDIDRLVNDYGWYKGDYFRDLMGGYIKNKTGDSETTFGQLEAMKEKGKPFRELHLIGSDLSTGFSKVFNAVNTPDVKIADAARVSMSIPLFFAAVKGVNGDDHVYVDGGLLDNFAIKVFDRMSYVDDPVNARRTEYYRRYNEALAALRTTRDARSINEYVYNKETLGFRLDAKEEIDMFLDPNAQPKAREIKTLFSYTKALVTTLIDFQNNAHLHTDDWQRTIYVDSLGVSSTDFDIPESTKMKLVEAGRAFTDAYFEWYDNDEAKANK